MRELVSREHHDFSQQSDAQEIRNLRCEISIIAKGRLVFTGATRELGADLDSFEHRLIELLKLEA